MGERGIDVGKRKRRSPLKVDKGLASFERSRGVLQTQLNYGEGILEGIGREEVEICTRRGYSQKRKGGGRSFLLLLLLEDELFSSVLM